MNMVIIFHIVSMICNSADVSPKLQRSDASFMSAKEEHEPCMKGNVRDSTWVALLK